MPAWFIVRNGREQGPVTAQQLKQLAATGQLRSDDLVRRDDMQAPRPAKQVKGLFETPPPPPQESPPPPTQGVPTAKPATDTEEWFYTENGVQSGPVSFAELFLMYKEGRLKPGDTVRTQGTNSLLVEHFFDSSASDPADTERAWFYVRDNRQVGPYPFSYLCSLAGRGDLRANEVIGRWGSQWLQASAVIPASALKPPGLFEELRKMPDDGQLVLSGLIGLGIGVLFGLLSGRFWFLSLAGLGAGALADVVLRQNFPKVRFAHSPAMFCALVVAVLGALSLVAKQGGPGTGEGSRTASDGPKLAAFRKVVEKYKQTPGRFASDDEREKFNRELRKLQEEFFAAPLDPKKNRNEAVAIIELYEKEIEKRYTGALPLELHNYVFQMASDLD